MGILNSIFGSSENKNAVESKVNWKNLEHIYQLETIINQSWEKPVLIFKHSTRCSISRMALKQFENEYGLENRVDAYFLDLLNYREISNEIALTFDVIHQSPQLIVIRNGVRIYDASHSDIDAKVLKSV